jgi:hypothetical protein
MDVAVLYECVAGEYSRIEGEPNLPAGNLRQVWALELSIRRNPLAGSGFRRLPQTHRHAESFFNDVYASRSKGGGLPGVNAAKGSGSSPNQRLFSVAR